MPRTYTSDLRTERSRQTRESILASAHELFVTNGWVLTTMGRVAERSGVTRQTVYLLFDSKLAVLDACIDRALSAGLGVRVRDLPEYQLMASGDFDARLAAGARWLAAAHLRSAAIQRVLDEAAVTDPPAAARLAVREEARWREVQWAMTLVMARPDPDDTMVDALWTLASRDVWLKLVGQRGWTSEQWQRWFISVASTYRPYAAGS